MIRLLEITRSGYFKSLDRVIQAKFQFLTKLRMMVKIIKRETFQYFSYSCILKQVQNKIIQKLPSVFITKSTNYKVLQDQAVQTIFLSSLIHPHKKIHNNGVHICMESVSSKRFFESTILHKVGAPSVKQRISSTLLLSKNSAKLAHIGWDSSDHFLI